MFQGNVDAVGPQLNHNRQTIFEIAEPAAAVSFNHHKRATKTEMFLQPPRCPLKGRVVIWYMKTQRDNFSARGIISKPYQNTHGIRHPFARPPGIFNVPAVKTHSFFRRGVEFGGIILARDNIFLATTAQRTIVFRLGNFSGLGGMIFDPLLRIHCF